MKCSEIQFNLSFYADGSLGESESVAVRDHLGVCPVCRQVESELRGVRASLRRMGRAEMPVSLRNSISIAVNQERRRANTGLPFADTLTDLLRTGFAPYGVGVAASLLVAFGFLTIMFMNGPGGMSPDLGGETGFLLASNSDPFKETRGNVSPAAYARSRLNIASESPSINPNGALVAITNSLSGGDMKNGEVVVVADVFGNGLAQIAEVVEPSGNARAVNDLQKALETDPAFAPFLPTTLENRPESVRVVLKFQSVNVSTRSKRARPRL